MHHDLLSFVRSDPDPPFPADRLNDHWWYVKPLLQYVYLYGSIPTELPNLWLGSMFVGHRFQMRRVMERAKPGTLAEFDAAISESTGDEEPSSGPVRDEIARVCTLRDPERFPDDSAVYRSSDRLAQAVELCERNTAALESTRRRLTLDAQRLQREVERLHSAVYVTKRLRERVATTTKG